jgi:DNA-nicking Smr family endonuclease
MDWSDEPDEDEGPWEEPGAVEIPIDGELDLHTFRPAELRDLVPEYLDACRGKGILHVRIVHGKGTGSLRRSVHAILSRLPHVASYRLAGETEGGWGATWVELRPAPGDGPDARTHG